MVRGGHNKFGMLPGSPLVDMLSCMRVRVPPACCMERLHRWLIEKCCTSLKTCKSIRLKVGMLST